MRQILVSPTLTSLFLALFANLCIVQGRPNFSHFYQRELSVAVLMYAVLAGIQTVYEDGLTQRMPIKTISTLAYLLVVFSIGRLVVIRASSQE